MPVCWNHTSRENPESVVRWPVLLVNSGLVCLLGSSFELVAIHPATPVPLRSHPSVTATHTMAPTEQQCLARMGWPSLLDQSFAKRLVLHSQSYLLFELIPAPPDSRKPTEKFYQMELVWVVNESVAALAVATQFCYHAQRRPWPVLVYWWPPVLLTVHSDSVVARSAPPILTECPGHKCDQKDSALAPADWLSLELFS